jgi:hypothetical protein
VETFLIARRNSSDAQKKRYDAHIGINLEEELYNIGVSKSNDLLF